MILEEFFSKECVDILKEILTYALKLNQKDREILATCIRDEADKQANATASSILIQIATQIESMKVSE